MSSDSNPTSTISDGGFHLHETPIENQRPIKVIVIGAGYSGIYLGIRIPERIRNCELVIYEKNAGIGGTWYENRYPGAACDVPSHSYQFTFDPKPDWSSMYAPSAEILDYLKDMTKKYSADRFIKLEHQVIDTFWDQNEGKWHVKVEKPDGAVFEDVGEVLISARGALNVKKWPNIPGLGDFQGEVMHSSAWNQSYNFENKRVGIIGSGSSAIQIIPKLQAVEGARLTCFMRNPTWISPPFAQQIEARYGLETPEIPPSMVEKFKDDPDAWQKFRMDVQYDGNIIHGMTRKGTEIHKGARRFFENSMKERLQKKPEYINLLVPSFSPWCRRITPGPGFLEALVEDNVNLVSGEISRIESKGIVTEDGLLHEIDVLACATGFYPGVAPPFPVRGINGKLLKDHWHQRATNYMSFVTDEFPNYFMMLGPNGAIGEGLLTIMIESAGDYIVKAIRKLQKENIKSMVIKPERVRDFLEHCDTYFQRTVYSEKCNSWYKQDGQGESGTIVTGLWPGSALHCIEALRSPRWEDFIYEYLSDVNAPHVNQLAWLGNGWAVKQLDEQPDLEAMSFYITPLHLEREIGLPVSPRPEENKQFVTRPWSY